jgi:7-keto-8-aminopelargonate synthetase-like enzyme
MKLTQLRLRLRLRCACHRSFEAGLTRLTSLSPVCAAPVLNFCANNYLGLSNHPKLVQAAKQVTTGESVCFGQRQHLM